jgi:glutathione S-transferase
VWIALEEKRVPYRVEKVNMRCYGDKTAEFVRMQPSGQIPVAEIDGKVYGQSNDILYALEEKFPGRPLLPPPEDAEATDRARRLLRLERELFSAWLSWLTGRSNNKSAFVSVLQRVENELGATTSGPFFLEGDEMSLVDVMYAPFLERMAASLCYYKGFVMRVSPGASTPYPNVNRWFDGMERHPSYRLTKSDYYTHAWDLPPQLGGCQREPAGEPFEAAINGESDHWRLPLEPDLGGIEPDWTWISPEQARRQAVERVSGNHEAIVRFASRGAGSPGFPGVSAPLADPNAVPNPAVAGSVDALMRIVCAALLQGADSQQDALDRTVRAVAWGEGDGDDNGNSNNKGRGESRTDDAFARGVVASLRYVRDRVGVPRDMTLPAARQLRAHLNWAIDAFARAGVS